MKGGDFSSISNDIDQLKELLFDSYTAIDRFEQEKSDLEKLTASLRKQKQSLAKEKEALGEELRLALHKLFDKKSEKLPIDDILQRRIFNGAEAAVDKGQLEQLKETMHKAIYPVGS